MCRYIPSPGMFLRFYNPGDVPLPSMRHFQTEEKLTVSTNRYQTDSHQQQLTFPAVHQRSWFRRVVLSSGLNKMIKVKKTKGKKKQDPVVEPRLVWFPATTLRRKCDTNSMWIVILREYFRSLLMQINVLFWPNEWMKCRIDKDNATLKRTLWSKWPF